MFKPTGIASGLLTLVLFPVQPIYRAIKGLKNNRRTEYELKDALAAVIRTLESLRETVTKVNHGNLIALKAVSISCGKFCEDFTKSKRDSPHIQETTRQASKA